MDSPCSEQLWVGCCASGRHKPWGWKQPRKIIKLPLQTFSLWFFYVLLQRCQWYKWMKAMLHLINILTHGQPRFKGANSTGQPRTSPEFSGHGSCTNKGWQKSGWSAAEPQTQTGPFCFLWSHCIRALIGELSSFPNCYCWNTETSTSKGAETHPQNKTWHDQEWHLALLTSSHHTKWAVLQHWSGDGYMAWHPSDAEILPCHWLAQRHCVPLTDTRSAQAPIGPDLALMDSTHFNVCQKNKKK